METQMKARLHSYLMTANNELWKLRHYYTNHQYEAKELRSGKTLDLIKIVEQKLGDLKSLINKEG